MCILDLWINNKSGAPIYEQIYLQIKSQIINGTLQEDAALPSIRNLANELEKDGFIYTVAGKGCFVAPKNVELLREENLKKIEAYIEEIMRLAASCNLEKSDIIEMIHCITEE